MRKVLLEDHIMSRDDLLAGESPSILFSAFVELFGYLLDDEPENVLSVRGMKRRQKCNSVLKTLGKNFLMNPQVFENRELLRNPNYVGKDEEICLSDEPVIWVANHGFKDDTLATVLAAKRNAYILFGSLPQFYNTFDGITAWLNGVIMVNRKVKSSRSGSVEKAVKAIEMGSDLIVFPEGVWNKTPNQLMLQLWPGIYRIAKETGARVVPIAHYVREPGCSGVNNPIHTVVDNPIQIDNLSEEAALEYIREVIGTWLFLMMERYGKTTREKMLMGYGSTEEVWEHICKKLVSQVNRYDKTIELCGDYRSKERIDSVKVWEPVANIRSLNVWNAKSAIYARQMVDVFTVNDFQRRF